MGATRASLAPQGGPLYSSQITRAAALRSLPQVSRSLRVWGEQLYRACATVLMIYPPDFSSRSSCSKPRASASSSNLLKELKP